MAVSGRARIKSSLSEFGACKFSLHELTQPSKPFLCTVRVTQPLHQHGAQSTRPVFLAQPDPHVLSAEGGDRRPPGYQRPHS